MRVVDHELSRKRLGIAPLALDVGVMLHLGDATLADAGRYRWW